MKKASELGLELIELEDQVLLVDENTVFESGDWAIHRHDWYREKYKQMPIRVNKSNKLSIQEHWCKIIASTKPLEGLPLLVIEDEVENLSKESYKKHSVHDDRLSLDEQIQRTGGFNVGFKKGYNKAKETYKFTEEDLRKAFKAGVDWQEGGTILYPDEEGFIKSLTKKELWIEAEYQDMTGRWYSWPTILAKTDRPTRVKITNNQIKAIWK